MTKHPKSYVGETVRIKSSGRFAVVLSDNTREISAYSRIRVKVRTLDGKETDHLLLDVETLLPEIDTLRFRYDMRMKFPALVIK